jgi:hypothetical protein
MLAALRIMEVSLLFCFKVHSLCVASSYLADASRAYCLSYHEVMHCDYVAALGMLSVTVLLICQFLFFLRWWVSVIPG